MEAASVRQQAPDAGLNISTETVAAAVPVEAAAERAAVPPPSRPKPEAPQPFETQRLGRMLQEEEGQYTVKDARQMELFEEKLLTKEAVQSYRILGQVFDTYWIAEYEEKLLFIDQHAAHEKVKYEALINKLENGSVDSPDAHAAYRFEPVGKGSPSSGGVFFLFCAAGLRNRGIRR